VDLNYCWGCCFYVSNFALKHTVNTKHYIIHTHIIYIYYIISIKVPCEWLLQYKCSWFPLLPQNRYTTSTIFILYTLTALYMSTVKTVVAPFLCWYTIYGWCMYIIYIYIGTHIQRKQFWSLSLNHTFSSLPFYNLYAVLSSPCYLYIVIHTCALRN